MSQNNLLKATPWDAAAFAMPTWEVLEYSPAALRQVAHNPGHHTIKVDPLVDKRLLHESGFYYCDTLIEPFCGPSQLVYARHVDASISPDVDTEQALTICHGAFSHGRFHRDFNLAKELADNRYDKWAVQLLQAKNVYGLYWQGVLAGFVGYSGTTLVLHALAEKYRGKGLSKYWWSSVCNALQANGREEVKSSISTTNLAVFKLYASLGFSFRNPQDVYHCLVL